MATPEAIKRKRAQRDRSSQSTDQAESKAHAGNNNPLSQEAVIAGLDDAGTFSVHSNKARIRRTYDLFRKTPEVVGIVKALVDDVFGDETPRFEYVGPDTTPGTQRIKDAKAFWEDEFHMIAEEAAYDYYIAGDAYIYERLVRDEDIKAIVDSHLTAYDFSRKEYKALARKRLIDGVKQAVDEDALTLQGAQIVPASTMYEDIDEHGNVQQFVQRVGGKRVEFDPDEIVHLENMPLDGEVYSFTPMFAMLEEIYMLAQIKDYHVKMFDNAGMANKLYQLPDETPNSQNYQQFIHTVRAFREEENTNKDMVTTGNVEVENLNDIDDTMEFESLKQSVVISLMQGWNMPPARLGIDAAGNQNESQGSSMAVEGYYKRIGREQNKWETYLNNEIFEPYFNVKINLSSPNVKQEIRKADRDQKKLNTALRMAAAGLLSRDGVRQYIGVEKTKLPDLEQLSPEEFQELAAQLAVIGPKERIDAGMSNAEVDGNEATDRVNDQRQETQEQNEQDGTTDTIADNG